MKSKTCSICKIIKPIDQFYLNRGRPMGRCKECMSNLSKAAYACSPDAAKRRAVEYREKNASKKREMDHNYYLKNKEKVAAQTKDWAQNNPVRRKAIVARYNTNHPGHKLARMAKYRHGKIHATPSWLTKEHLDEIKHIYATCPPGYHVDHIIPINGRNVCGLHVPWNLQHLPKVVNLRKSNFIESDNVCYQKKRRDDTIQEDRLKGMPFGRAVSDFVMSCEKMSPEHVKFIKRYEWLGTVGFGTRWVFAARCDGHLGGVVMIGEPTAYTAELKEFEALIQRGACASWTPKGLGSSLIMFACHWVVANTPKRIFVAYSDPMAREIGTIYQACNFDYLGNTFGVGVLYELSDGRIVGTRYFTRTNAMKRHAKEMGIEWKSEWCKKNGFQDIKAIPTQIRKLLLRYAYAKRDECRKIPTAKKGKYILLLPRDRREAKQLRYLKTWKSVPYPKRNVL